MCKLSHNKYLVLSWVPALGLLAFPIVGCGDGGTGTPKEWGDAMLIETNSSGDAYNPQVAVDPSGDAVAVWEQWDGTPKNIYSNRYTVTGGWGTAELVETDSAGDAYNAQVAIDPNGNAMAVWQQSDGMRTNIWSNRFTPAGGWGTAELIESDNAGDATSPQVAIDPSGNAMAVWEQWEPTRWNIWSNRYTPTGGWAAAEVIENDNAGDARQAHVAMDASGNAVAVWRQQTESNTWNIWSNRYTPTGGWGAAEVIETETGYAAEPQVAIDPGGNAVAVWHQSDGMNDNVWSNRYTPTGGWGAAERIETEAGYVDSPQVAIDPSGNAVAVWRQYTGPTFNIWSNRYTATGGWSTAELIETETGEADSPQVAIDPSGNALAVWEQWDGSTARENIWSNRYTATGGWSTAELIETDDAGNAFNPQVAIDQSGNAIAVWQQSDGTRSSIWSNHFK